MARPRIPLAKAEMTGALAKNPQRFRDRSEPPTQPLGKAPSFLSKEERRSWDSFAKEWPWLTEGDRGALIALCQMRAMIEDPVTEKTAALYTAYRLMIGEFGGTPTTRSKVFQPKSEEDNDPFAGFDGPVN